MSQTPGTPPTPSPHTVILGVGSPLMGDDAVGLQVVELLRQRRDLPPYVDVIDGGTDGLGLIPVLERYRRAIIVDAVLWGAPPGTIRRFTWQEVRLAQGEQPLSLHQSGLAQALALAEALHCLPDEVVFYGVQPQNRAWDQPLSQAVASALPALLEAVLHEVRSDTNHGAEGADY